MFPVTVDNSIGVHVVSVFLVIIPTIADFTNEYERDKGSSILSKVRPNDTFVELIAKTV